MHGPKGNLPQGKPPWAKKKSTLGRKSGQSRRCVDFFSNFFFCLPIRARKVAHPPSTLRGSKKKLKNRCRKKVKIESFRQCRRCVDRRDRALSEVRTFFDNFLATFFFGHPDTPFFFGDLWTGPAPRAGPVGSKVREKSFDLPIRVRLHPPCNLTRVFGREM